MGESATRSGFVKWLHRGGARLQGLSPEEFDPVKLAETLPKLRKLFGPDRAYFRTDVVGWENVPEAPCLVVGNHSGGTTFPDLWGFGVAWYSHFGVGRPIHSLAHEMVFAFRFTAEPFARLGVLRAQPEIGREVLGKWRRDLYVLPGGDLDTWRPFKDRHKVQFAGRKGYARLAIEMGVPIVPLAHSGSHHSLIVLTDGQKFAEKIGLHRLFRARIFPVHLSLPFGLTIGPTPHIPLPVRLRYRLGAPIVPPPYSGGPIDEAAVDKLDAEVQAAIQAELDWFAADERSRRDRAVKFVRGLRPRRRPVQG